MIDLFRLFDGRMIFPQDKHGIGIVLKAFGQSQRHPGFIHGTGGGAGGIHREAFDLFCRSGRSFLQSRLERTLQPFYIVQRMLPELIPPRIAVQALFPAGIIKNIRRHFTAVGRIHNDRAYGIRTIVHTDDKGFIRFHVHSFQ